jgi:hypothetical protein
MPIGGPAFRKKALTFLLQLRKTVIPAQRVFSPQKSKIRKDQNQNEKAN